MKVDELEVKLRAPTVGIKWSGERIKDISLQRQMGKLKEQKRIKINH